MTKMVTKKVTKTGHCRRDTFCLQHLIGCPQRHHQGSGIAYKSEGIDVFFILRLREACCTAGSTSSVPLMSP